MRSPKLTAMILSKHHIRAFNIQSNNNNNPKQQLEIIAKHISLWKTYEKKYRATNIYELEFRFKILQLFYSDYDYEYITRRKQNKNYS